MTELDGLMRESMQRTDSWLLRLWRKRWARWMTVLLVLPTLLLLVLGLYLAVRLAEKYTHPRVLSQTGGSLPGEMRLTFLVALLGMALLFVTLWKLGLTAKHASMQLKRLRNRARVAA